MKKKLCILVILVIIIFLIFISKNMIKKSKIGNNISSQEIVDKILNTNSYIAEIEVQVNSNKNKNKYIMVQEYNTENGCVQEVLEPSNIAGVKITKKDDKLSIENTNLSLKKIFENYSELENNSLDLYNFLIEYKNNSDSEFEEDEQKIIMKVKPNKVLYINKKSKLPEKLIIQDNNQKTIMSIKYNKIELK